MTHHHSGKRRSGRHIDPVEEEFAKARENIDLLLGTLAGEFGYKLRLQHCLLDGENVVVVSVENEDALIAPLFVSLTETALLARLDPGSRVGKIVHKP